MTGIRVFIVILWIVFWGGWLIAALGAKRSLKRNQGWQFRSAVLVLIVVVYRVLRPSALEVHSAVLAGIGAWVLLVGLLFAVWARVYLGRNWGMPATTKEDPELVTSGPYAYVRHPIYTGVVTGLVGTALATNLLGLVIAAVVAALFYYGAHLEERNLTAAFPDAYPEYQAHTKMLIPFLV